MNLALGANPNTGEPGDNRRPSKQHALRQKWHAVSINNKLIVIFAGLTAIATILYSGFAGWQLYEIHSGSKDTHALAEAAKSQAEIASTGLRPWIKITSIELRPGIGPIKTLGFHWPLTGATVPPVLQVKVSMLNVGHSLAQDIEVWPELFFGKFESDKWHDVVTNEQQRFCKSVIDRKPTGAANIVFPSDSSESNMGVGGIVHDADIIHRPDNPASYSAASLILCVNYKGVGSIPYQTQAWSGLYEDNQVLITVGLDADAGRLRLIREPNGDHAN